MGKYDDDEEGSTESESWPPSKHNEDEIVACIDADFRRRTPTASHHRIKYSIYLSHISFRTSYRRGWVYKGKL